MKKALAVMLALLMLAPAFASCGETKENTDEPNAGSVSPEVPSAEEAEPETEDLRVKTALPEGLDFAGAAYRIHNIDCSSYIDKIIAPEQTGDNLNDAIYNRDQRLMEDMNFTFEEFRVDAGEAPNAIRNLIKAGDDSYDMYVSVDWRGYMLAQEGYALPISALPYVDTDREYWSQSIHKDMSIRGKLYYAFGDHNLSTYDSVNILLFNKAMSTDLGLENHYQTVLEGAWTLDLMQENMMLATNDANGDGNGPWTTATGSPRTRSRCCRASGSRRACAASKRTRRTCRSSRSRGTRSSRTCTSGSSR